MSPIRVEDPMLWLMERETAVIKAQNTQESVKKSFGGFFRRRFGV